MRIREDNRNMVLLGAVTLLSITVAGVIAVIDPGPAPAAANPPIQAASLTDVRVVGTPFIPNTNPRER